MRKSVLLRRIILLLLSAVLLSGVLSAGIYILVTQQMYVCIKADELMPIARTVADMLANAQQGGTAGQRGVWPLLDRENRNFLGASLHIYNSNRESIMNPVNGMRGGAGATADEAEINAAIQDDLSAALSGKEVSGIRKTGDGHSFLAVCVPIRNNGFVVGAVIFTNPMSELNDTRGGLNLTLLISTLVAFLVMLIPGYFAAKRLVVPIRQMGEVARAMAKGDFSGRADENQKGEIGELGRAMNHFAEESGRLEQTRQGYVANVSHELRTPVAAIRAMGETLRDGMAKTPEKQNLFYENIVRESLRLSRLIDDLLELSRLQSGAEAMQKRSFSLREILQNAADMYGHMAAEAGLRFVPPDPETPLRAFGNPDRIEQTLVILLDNAMKHSGGEISLTAADRGGHVDVCVANTGGGIPGEDLPYIFDRFYKADKSHSGGGSGLGLSIAKEIMNRLGENIRAESGDGMTRFIFTVRKDKGE
ncbi:MAG: HAMP domain-containing histidine kinase [Clostridiales Family XIII bacterium]|jgi:signal transduction histidine kinase|nr:HAMP domain-containing histidine kinase [Clostridiales Family XIII bacterium]